MANEKRLTAFDPVTFESFTRHCTKHREPYGQYDMGYVDAVDNIENWMENNTVDAVEVVRCNDCKYRIHDVVTKEWFCNSWHSGFVYVKPNDFCSYGERKCPDE